MSFPVTWLPPPVSYSPVGARTNPKVDLYAFYSHFEVTSGQMTSLPVSEVTWRLPLTWRPPLASFSNEKAQTYPKLDLYAFYRLLQLTSVQMTSLWVTSGHVRSRNVISCHVTATSCEFQPCRSSNVPKTRIIRLPQPLPGDFRSNNLATESLAVTWGHVTSFSVTWWPPAASYSPVKAQTYPNSIYTPSTATCRWPPVKWRHFRVTSRHVTSFPIT